VRPWTVVAVATAILGANAFVLRGYMHGDHERAAGLWGDMETVKIPPSPDAEPVFPEALRSQEGHRISLSGVAFLMNAGVDGDRVNWCVLMPPSRYGCCGISCDPRPELSVYVNTAAHPWTASGRKQMVATVEGTLRLERGSGSWCLYTLDDAVVTPAQP
jgi:hypothetical protein